MVPVLDVVLGLVVFACLVVVYILVVAAVALDVYALVVVVRILVVFAMVVATCARTAIAVACAVVIDVCELSSLLWSSVWWLLVQRSSLCSRPRSCVCSGRWCNCRRQCTRRHCKCMYKVVAIVVILFRWVCRAVAAREEPSAPPSLCQHLSAVNTLQLGHSIETDGIFCGSPKNIEIKDSYSKRIPHPTFLQIS